MKLPVMGRSKKSGLFIPDPDSTRQRIESFFAGGVFHHAMRYRSQGDDRPDNELDWQTDTNIVTNVGLQKILDDTLLGGTQSSTWYLFIFANNYTPVAGDTASVIVSSYGEYTTISEATRPTWTGVRSSQTASNSASKATFTASGGSYPDTIYGAGLVNTNTKGGTSGTLMAASQFSTSRTYAADNDELIIQYDITASSS